MKKLTLLTAMLFALIMMSCDSKDEPKPFKFDPYSKVNLSPDMSGWKTTPQGQKAPANTEHLSPLEIVKQTSMMTFENKSIYGNEVVRRGFSEEQKDFNPENPKLKMFASDIINKRYKVDTIYLVPNFLEAENVTLIRDGEIDGKFVLDTIGYIPNETLRTAEKAIKEAYAKKDYKTVYKLFEDAYTFLPVTPTELKEIRK